MTFTITFTVTFTITFTIRFTITLDYIPLHYITLHYITLHYIFYTKKWGMPSPKLNPENVLFFWKLVLEPQENGRPMSLGDGVSLEHG